MFQKKIIFCALFLSTCGIEVLLAQTSIPTTGTNASGVNGSVSYTIGQILNNSFSGTNGTVNHGVQQPYEISIVTALNSTSEISLVCTVYPNPTRSIIKLVFESYDYENLHYRLYDIHGVLLQDKKVESSETEISLGNFNSSLFFLKVFTSNKEVKVFKIVKR